MSKRSVFICLSPSKIWQQPFGLQHTLNSLPKRHNLEFIFPCGEVKGNDGRWVKSLPRKRSETRRVSDKLTNSVVALVGAPSQKAEKKGIKNTPKMRELYYVYSTSQLTKRGNFGVFLARPSMLIGWWDRSEESARIGGYTFITTA